MSAAEKRRYFLQQSYFEEGNTGHLLALVARKQRDSSTISAIQSAAGDLHTLNPDILNDFHNFYTDLYASKTRYTSSELALFLQNCPFPQIADAERDTLNSPITLEELPEGLAEAPHHKSPRSNGLPAKVYFRYGDVLLPPLLQALSEAVETGCLPDSMQEAIIVALSKPGKDRLLPDSYRPISLLHSDVKLLARVLATRLSKVIGGLFHRDQSGFIPTRYNADNIRRLFMNLQVPTDDPGGRAILSLDATKAFDSAEWPYLLEILARFGLGNHFIDWVRVLYSTPRARLCINNTLLHGGTRHGCSLSPLLLALAVEPLAILILNTSGVVGFCRGPL